MGKKYFCYTDAGGTFTDTFIIDNTGTFVSGKSSTTPAELADGHINSMIAACDSEAMAGMDLEKLMPQTEVIGFGTTAIINTVLTRTGTKTGAIMSKGFEQLPYIGRGLQTYAEYSWEDILHNATHRHLDDLIPYTLIRGVTERVNNAGEVMIPLYEYDVRQAAQELIAEGVEAIVILFLYSYMYPDHELRAKEIVLEEAAKAGKAIEVFTSVEVSPVHRELNRFNALAIEAYGGSRARRSVRESERRLKALGSKSPMQITLSQGGLSSVAQAKMVETAMSGPVGGLMGGKFIGEMYGINNVITSDVGGTSFDVGLLSAGRFRLNMEPSIAGFLINVPYVQVSSIGAGGGTIAYVDPLNGRLGVGPKSAGAVPGPACYGLGGQDPTVTDADVILGYIDPEFFLGGRVKINKKLAEKAIKEKIADPLGIDVVKAAWGIKEIIDTQMENYCRSLISSKGYAIEDYTMMAFGGAGPTHCAGYCKNTPYKNVMMFPYSSVFCAFGAATADFAHHYVMATKIFIPYKAGDDYKISIGETYNNVMEELEKRAIQQFTEENFDVSQIQFQPNAFVRYNGQLEDIKVNMPMSRIKTPQDCDSFVEAFEEEYTNLYSNVAKYPEAGILCMMLGLTATVAKSKPQLPKNPLSAPKPKAEALKGTRQCYFEDQYYHTNIYNFGEIEAGNIIYGPAILEHIDTNYVVPPGHKIEVDEYMTLWLKKEVK
ncbi:MAG: hydantoinase/oxoprolinase family protein [Syntrophomonadaceae bacterium]|jgi:acetone carboxylase beta subunit